MQCKFVMSWQWTKVTVRKLDKNLVSPPFDTVVFREAQTPVSITNIIFVFGKDQMKKLAEIIYAK